MNRQFVEVPLFTKRWAEIGLGNEELLALQMMLLKNPESGPVMEGTGGIRKVRFPLDFWYEDTIVNYLLARLSNKYVAISDYVYGYRINEKGITFTSKKSKKVFCKVLNITPPSLI